MLPKDNRLTAKKDIDRTKKEGTLFQSKSFGILVFNRGDDSPSRFGTVVSTKVDNRAVKRNWARRIIKENLRKHLGEIVKGTDMLVLVKTGIKNTKPDTIAKEIKEILLRAKILK